MIREKPHVRPLMSIVLVLSASVAMAQPPVSAPAVLPPSAGVQGGTAPPTAEEPPITVGALFAGLGRDLAHLPSRDNFLTLFAGGALSQAVHHEDVSLTARAHASEPLDEVFDGGARTGSGWVQVGGAVGIYALGRLTGRPRVAEVGADLVQAQVLNTVMTAGLKLAVDRTRPDQGRYSFPSGHTSATFATATVLQRQLGWKIGAPAYAIATYVGASRMTENRHFASDVIFGAAIGVVAGRTVSVGHGTARFTLAPAVLPGGVGVAVTHPH